MPITPERKNPTQLARQFREQVTNRTGITDFDVDSKADALIQVFLDQVLAARNEAIGAFYSNQISNAQGPHLDILGQDMGVSRLRETYAEIYDVDQSLAFYVSSGTFGDLNGGSDIVIPAGTRVYTDSNENELGAEVSFRTVKAHTLPAASTMFFVGARATASGAIGNVGASVLKNHSFANYTAGNGLRVVNFYSVLNGRAQETDRNYRFRLARHYDTLSTSNYAKMHLTALRVPGVLDTRVVSGQYGIGSVAVMILGAENQSTASLISAVQARLNDIAGPSIDIRAVPATAAHFDLELRVKALRALTATEKRQFEAQMRRAMRNYFRTVGLGGSVSLLDASQEMQSYIRRGVRLTSQGRPTDIFKTVYVRKGPSGSTSTERDLLENQDFSLSDDEYADLGTFSVTWL